jgi:hypothetical protein
LRAATSPACWSEITQAHPAQPTLAQRPQEPAPEQLAGLCRRTLIPKPLHCHCRLLGFDAGYSTSGTRRAFGGFFRGLEYSISKTPGHMVGRPGLDPGTLGLKGHRFHYSLFIRFREPHIHRVLRSVRSVRSVRFVAIEKC